MTSPDDIILDEPERFSEKLQFQIIKKSKNPQKEFLKQMEKKWNQKNGLFLWKHFVEKYDLINAVYKAKYKKDLDKEISKKFFEKFREKEKNYQRRIEINREKIRKSGKTIKNHSYTNSQKSFILFRKKEHLYKLATEFNKQFNTKLSRNAIRDKRLRLLGKKN